MNLSTEAKTRIYEIVEKAVVVSLEDDPSKEFILAILNLRPDMDSMFRIFGESKTLLQEETDKHIKQLFKELLEEIFNKDFRASLKATILAESLEEKTLFAAKAAVSEFVDRVKAPIEGDLIKIRLFNAADEE